MTESDEKRMNAMLFEIIADERKNLKTKVKTDNKMVEEISKIILSYTKQRY